MRLRPLGWELAFFLGVLVVLTVGVLADSTVLAVVALVAVAIATPVAIVSCLVRLVAGVRDDARRSRSRRGIA